MANPSIIPAVSLGATVILALAGYVVTYLNNVRLEARRERAAHVSDQLEHLYGPLYSLLAASDRAWEDFRSRCRPGGSFFGRPPEPTAAELAEWRLWMSTVFMPMNLEMRQLVIENAHLIEGDAMPEPFISLISHVETYKVTLARWAAGDVSQHTAYVNFPGDLPAYVDRHFKALKEKQAELMR